MVAVIPSFGDPLILDALATAEAAIARFDAHAQASPYRARAHVHLVMAEALASGSLEGLKALPEAVFMLDADSQSPGQVKADRLAHDIRRAADWTNAVRPAPDGFPHIDDLFTLRDRASLTSSGREDRDPLEDTDGVVSAWRDLVAGWAPLTPLIRLALAVKAFEEMGAGGEDSGPLARLLVPVFLKAEGRTAAADLFVSPDMGSLAARKLAWRSEQGWVLHFLGVLEKAAVRSLDRLRRFEGLRTRFNEACPAQRSTSSMPAAIDWILAHPVFYGPDLAQALRTTPLGARQIVDKARRAGWLVKVRNPGGRFQIYVCDRVLALCG